MAEASPTPAPWADFTLYGALLERIRHPRKHLRSAQKASSISLVLWLVTALLCLVAGRDAFISFLRDLAMQARLLIAIPLMVALDKGLGDVLRDGFRRMAALVHPDAELAYLALVARRRRLLTSWRAEALLLTSAYLFIIVVGSGGVGHSGASWEIRDGGRLSAAGLFSAAIVFPFFSFLFFRWVFRYSVWIGFLLRVRRLRLRLITTHPDHSGGLAFIGRTQLWFALVFMALEWVAAGRTAGLIIWGGARLQDFAMTLAVIAATAVVLFASPPLLFTPALWRLRYGVLPRFDSFSLGTARAFERRWMDVEQPPGKEDIRDVLTSGDISALCDLHSIFESVHLSRMSPMPISRFIHLLTVTLAPATLPIAASVPLSEILKTLLEAVF